jgi:hypothetical protein
MMQFNSTQKGQTPRKLIDYLLSGYRVERAPPLHAIDFDELPRPIPNVHQTNVEVVPEVEVGDGVNPAYSIPENVHTGTDRDRGLAAASPSSPSVPRESWLEKWGTKIPGLEKWGKRSTSASSQSIPVEFQELEATWQATTPEMASTSVRPLVSADDPPHAGSILVWWWSRKGWAGQWGTLL